MTKSLALLALVLGAAAVWLLVDNPTIGETSRGPDYSCLAPWDTVLNGADNVPGGDPAPDAVQIAPRCREAGGTRFALAAGVGVLAAGAGGVALGARLRRP